MLTVDWLVLKDFLDAQSHEVKEVLLKNLSSDETEDLLKISKLPFHPHLGFSSKREDLHNLHYTWLIPFFQTLSLADKYLFISVVAEDQKTGLAQFFDLTKEPKELSLLTQDFLIDKLFSTIFLSDPLVLPISCLPDDPLNPLLTLSRHQLLNFVDLLSMHDLAYELPSLINASHIEKIKKLLTPTQRKYLSSLSKHLEPITFKSMGLSLWNGNEDSLKTILHQRGLNRLSKALVYSHPSFILHLQHKLDTGRASVVKNLIRQLKNKKAHQILIAQVCQLLEIVKT